MKTRKRQRHTDSSQQDKTFFPDRKAAQSGPSQDGFFQTKLKMGTPGDKFEQEADRVADAVVNRTDVHTGQEAVRRQSDDERDTARAQPEEEEAVQAQEQDEEGLQAQEEEEQLQAQEEEEELQAQEEEEEAVQAQEEEEEAVQAQDEEEEAVQSQQEDEESVQAKSKGQGSAQSIEARLKQRSGRGQPLPPKTRKEMEAAFKSDFSAVRVHTDTEAAEMSDSLGAQAFTHGNDIYFNEGRFNPDSSKGKHLLAHELTHTKQQNKK